MTPEEIENEIQSRLTTELALPRYDGLTQQQAYEALHATSQVESVVRPAEITLVGLLGDLSAESKGKVCGWVHLLDFRAKVLAQDRQGVGIYLDLLLAAGSITQEEAKAAMAQLQATETAEVFTECTPRIWLIVGGIPGGPNSVTEKQFATAWAARG
jgi:hypothetical protein